MRRQTEAMNMTRWLMLWKFNPLAIPADREQAAKVRMTFNEMTKKMLEAGVIQDWGIYGDASGGFALWDDRGDSEAHLIEALGTTFMMMPFMTCDVRPVLDIEQGRASIRRE
ncbi:MAG: hypothetical protein AB7S61_11395 [Methanoregulaceae archaeon]